MKRVAVGCMMLLGFAKEVMGAQALPFHGHCRSFAEVGAKGLPLLCDPKEWLVHQATKLHGIKQQLDMSCSFIGS